jgi:hypothetical protein
MYKFLKTLGKRRSAAVAPSSPKSNSTRRSSRNSGAITLRVSIECTLNKPIRDNAENETIFQELFSKKKTWLEGAVFTGVNDAGRNRSTNGDIKVDTKSLILDYHYKNPNIISPSIEVTFKVFPGDTEKTIVRMFEQAVSVWSEKSASQIHLEKGYRIDRAELLEVQGLEVLKGGHRTRRSKRN